MDTRYLERIVDLARVANPVDPPSEDDWREAEGQLALSLPADYKALVSRIGSGHFGDLGLLSPLSCPLRNTIRDLHTDYFVGMAADLGVTLFPTLGGYVTIGVTGCGRSLLARTEQGNSEHYDLCWFCYDFGEVEFPAMSVCQFIYDLYMGMVNEPWAIKDRNLLWMRGTLPFFTPSYYDPEANEDRLNR